MSEIKPRAGKGDGREEFDEQVPDGDGSSAVRTFSTEPEPGDDWDVEPHWDLVPAMRTVRWGRINTFIARHPVDADIEKAPNKAAENKKDNRPKMERHSEQAKIENPVWHGSEEW